ncbi:MAG TPA: DHA2 family efflux MFS transporter permease subunit [Candidatus Paceibacterota bacterium]|nr:DHA2 family efflux MFS transporter permease subunit [Candidatus Paceibacterota bacterium]
MQEGTSRWLVLATVIVGTFLGRLDQTVVNLALPKIISDFNITVTSAAWIATAYIIANAVFVPVWGKLGDTMGRKKIYIFGFLMFIVGSVLAGAAWNLTSMIIFRIIQAIAGSADYPTAMAILTMTFPAGKERSMALGIWSGAFASAAVFGPLIGGPIIDSLGWRWVFYINVPVGIIGLLMAWYFVHESVGERTSKGFDWTGATTLGIALAALVAVLDQGQTWGWLSLNSTLCYALIILFGVIFYYTERNHEEPVIDFKFFKNAVFVNALSNNFLLFMSMMGSIFLIPVFAQTFLGYSATQSGYLFIPMGLTIPIAAAIGSRFSHVEPRWVIFVSTAGAALGFYFLSFLDPRTTAWEIIWPLVLMAFFMGSGMAQRTNVIASAVPQSEIGIASGILALARNIGGAFGIAIFGTILQNTENSNVLTIAAHSIIRSTNPDIIQQGIALIELKAEVAAYGYVFLLGAIAVFISAFPVLLMRTSRDAAAQHIHVEG